MTSSTGLTRDTAPAALQDAAHAALQAPSVFNTQPWRWRIAGDVLELFVDRSRALPGTDRDGRLMMLSCGAAVHHARTALAAAGWSVVIERLPDAEQPDLLSRLHLDARVSATPSATALADAIALRRTDRRAFADTPADPETLTQLVRLVEHEGAYLHVVRPDEVATLAAATDRAARAEQGDPQYLAELSAWTNRPTEHGDGIKVAAVAPDQRRVPGRDFTPDDKPRTQQYGPQSDKGATYVILWGASDDRIDLLHGGEAMSAMLLAATAAGLATATLSESIEVEWPRHLLRGLLSDLGEPYVVVRLGHPGSADLLPPTARRDATDVIVVSE